MYDIALRKIHDIPIFQQCYPCESNESTGSHWDKKEHIVFTT